MRIDIAINTATGTNTYAITQTPAWTAYLTNQIIYVLFTNANSGTSTLNVDGLGAKTINNFNCAAGQILALVYDGTNFQVVSNSILSTTQSLGDNTTKQATTAFVQTAITNNIPPGNKVFNYQTFS